MCKRIMLVFTLLCAMVLSSGCSLGGSASVHDKVQKMITELESYECEAEITRISNKGENVYTVKQWNNITGEYKMEMTAPENVAGNYTVYDGVKVCQYNPKMNSTVAVEVEENQARNELFLCQFIKNYLQSEEVAIEVDDSMDEGVFTVLEAVIPGNYKYTATEKLWIDNETLLPTQLVIYDIEGNERYIVKYTDFTYNAAIDPSVFQIPN